MNVNRVGNVFNDGVVCGERGCKEIKILYG